MESDANRNQYSGLRTYIILPSRAGPPSKDPFPIGRGENRLKNLPGQGEINQHERANESLS